MCATSSGHLSLLALITLIMMITVQYLQKLAIYYNKLSVIIETKTCLSHTNWMFSLPIANICKILRVLQLSTITQHVDLGCSQVLFWI
jgi:hypothetical protein